MRILFITSEIPYPPSNGVRIVSYNAIRLMREAGHDLSLLTLTNESWDIENRLAHMKNMCEHVECHRLKPKNRWLLLLKTVLGGLYFLEKYKDTEFRSRLTGVVEEFCPDAIHFDTILMTQYVDVAKEGVRTVASINDSHTLAFENLIASGAYSGLERWYRKLEVLKSRKYETSLYPDFDVTHVMANADADYLSSLSPDICTSVIPNGVPEPLFSLPLPDFNKPSLVIVANWGAGNIFNLECFLEETWRIVRDMCHSATLSIVGHFPRDARKITALSEEIGNVHFLGYVDSIEEVYSNACIALVPVQKNCGIINKSLEGMAAAHCVVGLEQAFTGIPEAKKDIHYSSSDDLKDLGKKIAKLISEPEEMQKLGKNARELMKAHYSWGVKLLSYQELYVAPSLGRE